MQDAFDWYELQKSGLGYVFLEELEGCFQKICDHPEYYGLLNEWIRRVKVNGFPYLVVYEIENDYIVVNSVFHTSRSPKR